MAGVSFVESDFSSPLNESWSFCKYVGGVQPEAPFPCAVRNPNKAICTIDAKTSEILTANELACDLFAYERSEMVGCNLVDMIRLKKKDQDTIMESYLKPNGEIVSIAGKVVDALDKNGLALPVSLWLKRVNYENKPRCLVVMEPVERTVATVHFKKDGTILSCDAQLAYIHGYSAPEEVNGMRMNQLIPALKLPQNKTITKDIKKQRATGRTKDGSVFPLSICIQRVKSNGNSPGQCTEDAVYEGVLWVFASITGLITFLPDGTIHSINHHFALLLFGYTSQELIGKKITTLIPDFYGLKSTSCRMAVPDITSVYDKSPSHLEKKHEEMACILSGAEDELNSSKLSQIVPFESTPKSITACSKTDRQCGPFQDEVQLADVSQCWVSPLTAKSLPAKTSIRDTSFERENGPMMPLQPCSSKMPESSAVKLFASPSSDSGVDDIKLSLSAFLEKRLQATTEKQNSYSSSAHSDRTPEQRDSRNNSRCLALPDLQVAEPRCILDKGKSKVMPETGVKNSLNKEGCEKDNVSSADAKADKILNKADCKTDSGIAESETCETGLNKEDCETDGVTEESIQSNDDLVSKDCGKCNNMSKSLLVLSDYCKEMCENDTCRMPIIGASSHKIACEVDLVCKASNTKVREESLGEGSLRFITCKETSLIDKEKLSTVKQDFKEEETDDCRWKQLDKKYRKGSEDFEIDQDMKLERCLRENVNNRRNLKASKSHQSINESIREDSRKESPFDDSNKENEMGVFQMVSREKFENNRILMENGENNRECLLQTSTPLKIGKTAASDTPLSHRVLTKQILGAEARSKLRQAYTLSTVDTSLDWEDTGSSEVFEKCMLLESSPSCSSQYDESSINNSVCQLSWDSCGFRGNRGILASLFSPRLKRSFFSADIQEQDGTECDGVLTDGEYAADCRHKDGSNIRINFELKRIEMENGCVIFCMWVSRSMEENPAVGFSNFTMESSLDVTADESRFSSSRSYSDYSYSVEDEPDDEGRRCYERHYKTVHRIGKGAFGFVELAVERTTQQQVAVKFIRRSKVLSDNWVHDPYLGCVPLEVKLLCQLSHSNIVRVLDVFGSKGYIQMVMEKHGNGMDLFEFIDRKPILDEPLCSYFFRQMVSAVAYLHKNNILHRDIKDENIVVDESFCIKLIDFGSAAFMEPNKSFATFCGTLEYCSPEVLLGNTYKGPKLEVWTMGVTLYTLVFGENPFFDIEETIECILRPPFTVSKSLLFLLSWMLDPDPVHRAGIQDLEVNAWVDQSIDISKYKWHEVLKSADLQDGKLSPGFANKGGNSDAEEPFESLSYNSDKDEMDLSDSCSYRDLYLSACSES